MRSKGAPTMPHARNLLAAGLTLALAAACHQDELFTPLVPSYAGGAMFQRYVSFGNSITAGIQSGGLNDSLQKLAYPDGDVALEHRAAHVGRDQRREQLVLM